MKTIGLIGGMSWESTAHYYAVMNRETARLRGGLSSAPILLDSLDFAPIADMLAGERFEEIERLITNSAERLERAGAGLIGMACNTMHIVAPAIEAALSIPFLHIADPTADALEQDGITRVGLLGTRVTLEMPFYRDRLAARGFDVLVPEINVTNLDAIISRELCKGVVSEPSRRAYVEAIGLLATRGAEAVILGCTEIGMLIEESVSPLPVYDTTELHARALVAAALEESDRPAISALS